MQTSWILLILVNKTIPCRKNLLYIFDTSEQERVSVLATSRELHLALMVIYDEQSKRLRFEIPTNLTLGGVTVAPCDVANSFAGHISSKINLFVKKTIIKQNVYNGKN